MAFGIFLFRDWVNNMGGICVSGEETDDLACSERRLVSVVITDTTVLGRLDLQRIGSYIRFNLDACAKSEAERPHFLLATYSSTATGHIVDAMDKAGCKIPMLTPGAALDVRTLEGRGGGRCYYRTSSAFTPIFTRLTRTASSPSLSASIQDVYKTGKDFIYSCKFATNRSVTRTYVITRYLADY